MNEFETISGSATKVRSIAMSLRPLEGPQQMLEVYE